MGSLRVLLYLFDCLLFGSSIFSLRVVVVEEQKDRVRECERFWCGGWDLNPRRPTPREPESRPFVLARAPPHTEYSFTSLRK